jgi:glycosyltransferase involved in cell wall biosynthesis
VSAPRTDVPLVSIIVPLYNHARYVEATLESFAREGHPNLEIVMIDDGSKDDSFAVARAWFDRHPTAFSNVILERQENAGITKTLNRLVARTGGEFVTMVASDDLLLPGGIAARLAALEARPDWLAVFGDATVIDDHGIQTAPSALRRINRANLRALERDEFRAQELILRWSVPGPVLLYRRQTLDTVGGYDESMILEDRDFYLRLLAHQALGFLPRPVAAYRLHARNTIRLTRVRRAVYDAVYRSEVNHLNAFRDGLRDALEFVTHRSKLHVDLSAGRWPRAALATVRIAANTFELHRKLSALDRQVDQVP